ncbi:hypothetical protein N9W12_08220 [Luminiphilus sp.]|nr:hypothetical protein [Luminiphilus sp.]
MCKYLKTFMPLLSAVIFLLYPQNPLASEIPSVRTVWLKCAGEVILDRFADLIEQLESQGVDSSRVDELEASATYKMPSSLFEISVLEDGEFCTGGIEGELIPYPKLPLKCEPNGQTYSVDVACIETGQCDYRLEIDRRELSFSAGYGMEVNGVKEYFSATGQCEISDAAI